MIQPSPPEPLFIPELEEKFWKLYRDFFDLAERRRRWRIRDDIPWDQCNANLHPAIADVVESFCAVEMYLPDYTSKILPVVRGSKGRIWFYANWGYEESKHSLAFSDWLLAAGFRTEDQLRELTQNVFEHEWNLPEDSHLGMLLYAMVQEKATWLNYHNLRKRTQHYGGDGALEEMLKFIAVDEVAHYAFFRDCVKLYLEVDRPYVLQQLRHVAFNFRMPAIHDLLKNPHQRVQQVQDLEIFSERIYYNEVLMVVLKELEIDRKELRERIPEHRSQVQKP